MKRTSPLLHRDDPDKEPLVGHIKATREDWLNVARDVLISEGVAEVKVLGLGTRINVSRSSFYWYFKNREHLLAALLDEWEDRSTRTLLKHCALPAQDISHAVCNFFRCFVDPGLFDRGLDFAVREWSRRDAAVRQRLDDADQTRLAAVRSMFMRHGYDCKDADARARILYFMQLGYHALEVREPMQDRIGRVEGYLRGFTGIEPDPDAVAQFKRFAISQEGD